MKKLLIVLVVAVLVSFLAVRFGLDPMVRTGVEKGGGAAFGTRSSLADASVSLLGGAIQLKNFEVGNPPGFQSSYALSVGSLEVKTNLASFLGDVVEVERIIVDAPQITLDFTPTSSNLMDLLENLRSHGGGEAGGTAETPPAEASKDKKFRVDLVQVNGARVTVAQSVLTGAATSFTLPDLELKNLTNAGTPATAADSAVGADDALSLAGVLERILGGIVESITKNQSGISPDLLKQLQAGVDLEGLESRLEEETKALEKDLEKKAQDAVGEATGKLQGLLKKKD